MLQLYPVYLLWNRRKTLTGSPGPTHMQPVQINLAHIPFATSPGQEVLKSWQQKLGVRVRQDASHSHVTALFSHHCLHESETKIKENISLSCAAIDICRSILVADPGFPRRVPTPKIGIKSYYLGKFSPKTWTKRGQVSLGSLGPASLYSTILGMCPLWFIFYLISCRFGGKIRQIIGWCPLLVLAPPSSVKFCMHCWLIPLFWTSGDIWLCFKVRLDPFLACFDTCMQQIPQGHLWYDNCSPVGGQHGTLSMDLLTTMAGAQVYATEWQQITS